MSVATLNSFPHLPDCEHLDDGDQVLLRELRDVLDRHEAVDRFGIYLLHRHFDVNNGEIMVETSDVEERTLTLKPRQIGGDADSFVPTQWRFVSDNRVVEVTQRCMGFGHNK